ncbi:MAG: antitoxin [Candidatus Binatia bacterium]|nr:MAG: antitoxin [Candidatus Binatia bacterium]
MKTINASEFKARCLEILDRVAAGEGPVLIRKRGRPVAELVPPRQVRPQDALHGTVHIHGDVVSPVLPPDAWEAEAGRKPR